MGNIFYTGDYHFFHRKILEYDKRPFATIEEHNETIIQNHNSVVKPNDIVYYGGDFIFGTDQQFLDTFKRLNGKFHVTFGNHDKIARRNKHLFKSSQDYLEMNINGQFIVMCHYAFRVWNRSHHGSWNIFFHSHQNLPPIGKQLDAGINGHNYFPWHFDEIKTYMDSRSQEKVDHHG